MFNSIFNTSINDDKGCKTMRELSIMKHVGQINGIILDTLSKEVEVGMPTSYLNKRCLELCEKHKVKPSCLDYDGFPAAICVSVNDNVCHGVPRDDVILKEGDILNLDVVTNTRGLHADSSVMVMVGECSDQDQKLVNGAYACMWHGISNARGGQNLYSLAKTIQDYAESLGLSIITSFSGHAVGRKIHESPSIFNHCRGLGKKDRKELKETILLEDMTITIEPLVTFGTGRKIFYKRDDIHSAYNQDGKGAYWEHTIRITNSEPEVLTLRPKEKLLLTNNA